MRTISSEIGTIGLPREHLVNVINHSSKEADRHKTERLSKESAFNNIIEGSLTRPR